MSRSTRYIELLSALLPAGSFGVSLALAASLQQAQATNLPTADKTPTPRIDSVANRLQAIREAVSDVTVKEVPGKSPGDPNILLAQWGNWHNGWGNGGWHNWHNGWGNGGWHNWHNGWGNGGWHNWHNGGGWGNGGGAGWRNWHNV